MGKQSTGLFDVEHSKRLAPTQFDAMKGSNLHATMTARRVWLRSKNTNSNAKIDIAKAKVEEAIRWLAQNATNFYFVADKSSTTELRVYFLSKHDMEHFIVWAKVAIV